MTDDNALPHGEAALDLPLKVVLDRLPRQNVRSLVKFGLCEAFDIGRDELDFKTIRDLLHAVVSMRALKKLQCIGRRCANCLQEALIEFGVLLTEDSYVIAGSQLRPAPQILQYVPHIPIRLVIEVQTKDEYAPDFLYAELWMDTNAVAIPRIGEDVHGAGSPVTTIKGIKHWCFNAKDEFNGPWLYFEQIVCTNQQQFHDQVSELEKAGFYEVE